MSTLTKWQREMVRSLFHYSRKRMRIEQAHTVKGPHVLASLFKFREFQASHVAALEENVLWASTASTFNDPYDSFVFHDSSRAIVQDHSLEEVQAEIEKVKAADLDGVAYVPPPVTRPIDQAAFFGKLLDQLLPLMSEGVREKLRGIFEKIRARSDESLARHFAQKVRDGYSIISLAENLSSTLMWAHYAKSHTGFSVEYDLRQNPFLLRLTYPVFYRAKITNASRWMRNADNFNNLFPIYMTLTKSVEWSYEREWRFILPDTLRGDARKIAMPKPTSITLRVFAKDEDVEWMNSYCSKHQIELRQMHQHHRKLELAARPYVKAGHA